MAAICNGLASPPRGTRAPTPRLAVQGAPRAPLQVRRHPAVLRHVPQLHGYALGAIRIRAVEVGVIFVATYD